MPRFSDLDRLFRPSRLVRSLAEALPTPPGAAVITRISLERTPPWDSAWRFRLLKDRRTLLVGFDYSSVLRSDRLFKIFRSRGPAMVYLFARTRPEIVTALFDISDSGGSESVVGVCSPLPAAILVPDGEFYLNRGYAALRTRAAFEAVPWGDRDPAIVWRGSTTGRGLIATDTLDPTDSRLIQRTRLGLAARGIAGMDVKMTRVVQSADPATDLARLEAAGLVGAPLDPMSWGRRRFALDVDGNSNTWSNLFTRFLLGCCVLKVDSAQGFRQWYYDDLRPFEHFVPVAADLSDLREKVDWCRSHSSECEEIAAAGAKLAYAKTFEVEMARAVGELDRRL